MTEDMTYDSIMTRLLHGEVYWNHLTGECVLYDRDFDDPEWFINRNGIRTFRLTAIDLAKSWPNMFVWVDGRECEIERNRAVWRIMTEEGWHLSRTDTNATYLIKAMEAMR